MSRTRLMLIACVVLGFGLWIWANYFRVDIVNLNPSGKNVIAFGDSLTSGVGARAGEDYPARLSLLLGRKVINAGISGETTAHALARVDKDVLSRDPGVVIILLGGNDMLQRLSMSQQFTNLEKIVDKIQSAGALVVLVGMKGLPFDQGYNGQYKDLAKRKGCVFVPDILSGIIDNLQLKSDQVHPNAKGYQLIAERVAEAVRPYLA